MPRIFFIKLFLFCGICLTGPLSFCWAGGSVGTMGMVGSTWFIPGRHSHHSMDFQIRPDTLRQLGIDPDNFKLMAGHLADTENEPGDHPLWNTVVRWLSGDAGSKAETAEPDPERGHEEVAVQSQASERKGVDKKCRVDISNNSGLLSDPETGLDDVLASIPEYCDIVLHPGYYPISHPLNFRSGHHIRGVVATDRSDHPANPVKPEAFGFVSAVQPEGDSDVLGLMSLVVSSVEDWQQSYPSVPVIQVAPGYSSTFMLHLAVDAAITDVAIDLQGLPVSEGLSCHQPVTTSSRSIRTSNLLLLNGSPCNESMFQDAVLWGISNIGTAPQPRSAMWRNRPPASDRGGQNGHEDKQRRPPQGRENTPPSDKPQGGAAGGGNNSGNNGGDENRPPNQPQDSLIFDKILDMTSLVDSLVNHLVNAPDSAKALADLAQFLQQYDEQLAWRLKQSLVRLINTSRNISGWPAVRVVNGMKPHHWKRFYSAGGFQALISEVFCLTTRNDKRRLIVAISEHYYLEVGVDIDWYDGQRGFLASSRSFAMKELEDYHPDYSIVRSRDGVSEVPADAKTVKREAIRKLLEKIKRTSDPGRSLRIVLSTAVGGIPADYMDDDYMLDGTADSEAQFEQLLMTTFLGSDVSSVNALLADLYEERIVELYHNILVMGDPEPVLLMLYRIAWGRELAKDEYAYLQELMSSCTVFQSLLREGFSQGRMEQVPTLESLELRTRGPLLAHPWLSKGVASLNDERVLQQHMQPRRLHLANALSRESLLHESEPEQVNLRPQILIPSTTSPTGRHVRHDSSPEIMGHTINHCPAPMLLDSNPQSVQHLSSSQYPKRPRLSDNALTHTREYSVPVQAGGYMLPSVPQCPMQVLMTNGKGGYYTVLTSPSSRVNGALVVGGYISSRHQSGRANYLHQSADGLDTLERRRCNVQQIRSWGRGGSSQAVSCEQSLVNVGNTQCMAPSPLAVRSLNQDPGVTSLAGGFTGMISEEPPQYSQSAGMLHSGPYQEGDFFHGHSDTHQVQAVNGVHHSQFSARAEDLSTNYEDPPPPYSPPHSPHHWPGFGVMRSTPLIHLAGAHNTQLERGGALRSSLPVTQGDRVRVDHPWVAQDDDEVINVIQRRLNRANRAALTPFVWRAGRERYMSGLRQGWTFFRGVVQWGYDSRRGFEKAHKKHLDRRVRNSVHFQSLIRTISVYLQQECGWMSLAYSLSQKLTSSDQVNALIEAIRIASHSELHSYSQLPFAAVVEVSQPEDLLAWVLHEMVSPLFAISIEVSAEVTLATALIDLFDDQQLQQLIERLRTNSGFGNSAFDYDV